MQTRVKRLKVLKSSKIKGGFSYEFRIYKLVTWPCGLWPLEKDNIFKALRYLIATSSQLFIVVTTITEIHRKCGNAADVLDYYALSLAFFLSFLRLIFVRIHLSKVHNNCQNARKDWENVKNPDLLNIMISHAKTGKKFYYVQMTIAYFIFVLYTLNPFILRRHDAANLPVQTVCTFNDNTSMLSHTSVYLIQCVSFVYLACGIIGMDVLFLGIVMHLCGQLRILQKQFSEIGESMSHADSIRYVISLSKRYRKVVELTNDIKETFSEILLANFVMNTFLITSQSVALLLALKINNYFMAMKCSQTFPILLIEMFLYCYVGELLGRAFDDISGAIYNSRWYLLPPKIRRDYLLFVMAQANKTFDLTAGKMIRMNMSTFIQLVRSIVSFFSLLLLMFDR